MKPAFVVLILGGPLLGIAIGCFVLFLLSRGGWHKLAKYYTTPPRQGQALSWQTVTAIIGFTRYKKSMNLALQPEGVYLEPKSIFKLFHPRLLIPFDEIMSTGEKSISRYDWFYFKVKATPTAIAILVNPASHTLIHTLKEKVSVVG